ncbi:cytochrome P450 [Nocardiopsis valliformis]|uniref:cytochrome P450 n=1 Tax=Nocardiopsis valliformis TaxID=239974 RepID=UPI00034860FF|nr:cytochrome P450 [Nocardiopsis valliformis]
MSHEPVRLYGPDFQSDPAGLFESMRSAHGPVVPVHLDGDVPAWLVLGYRELHRVLSTPKTFGSDSRRWNGWAGVPQDWPLMPLVFPVPNIQHAEGDQHRRHARVIDDALNGVEPYELRQVTTRIADRLIDSFCASGQADLRSMYAHRLPALVLCWTYGLDDDRGDALTTMITTMLDAGADSQQAYTELSAALHQVGQERRAEPGADVVSRMIAHPAGYSDEELVVDLLAIVAAGQQTTADWIGNALRLMLTDSRFSASMAGARSSAGEALSQVLWEDSPCQIHAGRYAVQDVELAGQIIRRGDLVLLSLAAGNRDPRMRPDGGSSGERGNKAHLSFSHGEHRCPYPAQDIGETIANTGIEVLLDRLPDIELALPASELRWRPSPWVRGVASLPVTFTPALPRGAH